MLDALDITAAQAALLVAIFAFGGVVKGATGFGLPLVTISLTPLVAPVDLALALNTLILPIANSAQFVWSGHHVASVMICWPIMLGVAITAVATPFFIAGIEPAELSGLLGAFLLVFTALSVRIPDFRIAPRYRTPAAFGAGLAGGVVGAVLTAPGPVFLTYLVSLRLDRRQLMSATGLLMTTVGLIISASFAAAGILNGPRALASAGMAVPVFAGMWVGDRIGARMSVEAFRKLVLLMLFGLGLYHLSRSLA